MSDRTDNMPAILEQLEPRLMLSTTVLLETFESSFPGDWSRNVSQNRMWDDTLAKSHSGNWSVHCAETTSQLQTNNYVNNMDSRFQQTIDLSDFLYAELSFWYWANTEWGADYCELLVNGNTAWLTSGDHQSWNSRTVDLDAYAGLSSVTLTFRFTSSAATIPAGDSGLWLDDILVTATGPDENDQISEATSLSVGSSVIDDIDHKLDVDMYRVYAAAGERVGFDINRIGDELDSRLRLFDGNGLQLASNDDDIDDDPRLVYTFSTAGHYYIGVSTQGNDGYDPIDGTGDVNFSSDIGRYSLYVQRSARVGDGFYKSITILDDGGTVGDFSDDTSTTISQRGGSAEISYTGSNLSTGVSRNKLTIRGSNVFCSYIDVDPRGRQGRLSFRVRGGDGRIEVGDIVTSRSLLGLSAGSVNLVGHLFIKGASRKIQLGDVAGGSGQTISIGGVNDPKVTLALTMGHVENLAFNSDTPLKSVRVIDWTATGDSHQAALHAPWVGKLMTTGQRANARRGLLAIDGDFEADLGLTKGVAGPRWTLGGAKIAGNLGHASNDVSWIFTGDMNKLDVRGAARNVWAYATGSIAMVKLGGATHSDFLAGCLGPRHADEQSDFHNPLACIKRIAIMGRKQPGGTPQPRCFMDSNFSSANIGSVQLMNVDGDNGGESFGIWALEEIGSIRISETEEGWVGAPTPDLFVGAVT